MSMQTSKQVRVETQTECPGCGYFDTGKFCSNCGSVISGYKINLSYLVSNILEWEDKVTHTTTQLLFNPHGFLKAYMEGSRTRTYIPFKYLFFCFGMFCFVNEMFSVESLYADPVDIYIQQVLTYENDVTFEKIVGKFGKFFTLMFIPFFLLASRLLFPKAPYNLAERATAITYMLGMLMMVQVVLSLITAIIHPFYFIKPYIVLLLELYIVFILSYRFFGEKLIHSVWKSALTFIIIMAGMYGTMALLDFFILLFS